MAYTTINKSSAYFDTLLWTGNSASDSGTQNITGLNFQPGFIWNKTRSAENHILTDVLRGTNSFLRSNATTLGYNPANCYQIPLSNGFTAQGDEGGEFNYTNINYVSWNWKAGTTTGLVTNGDTDITPSSYSFNQTSGFSIIRYTGIGGTPKQIPHGLGVKPKMFIIKRINASGSWGVLPQQLGTGHLYLDGAQAISNTNPLSGGVLADAVNFSVSDSGDVNASGGTYVAYCFADVTGFSNVGSYIGNGSANGTFIYTGFKPAWVLIKDSGRTESWFIFDTKRDGNNGAMSGLSPNNTSAEGTTNGTQLGLLSNGFKLTGTTDHLNGNNQNFIYMAFAEAPLVGSNNVPATAR
jgi:hypothetical protein